MNYCENEHVALAATGAFADAIPKSCLVAWASDVEANSGSWEIESSVDFEGRGVAEGNLCLVEARDRKGHLGSGGTLFVVSSAGDGSATLRRVGWADGIGEPPGGPDGISLASAAVYDLSALIEDVSYRLSTLFGIDETLPGFGPGELLDPRQLRHPCALRVLSEMYLSATREKEDVWERKAAHMRRQADEIEKSLLLKWKNFGYSPYSSRVVAKVSRG